MSAVNEIKTHFGRCRCCLSYGYPKNMWTQYMGEEEIYGEMLVDCFGLSWVPSEEDLNLDQICDDCIARLRDARSFKQLVLHSQDWLRKESSEEKLIVKEVLISENSEDSIIMVYNAPDNMQITMEDTQLSGDDTKLTDDDTKSAGDNIKLTDNTKNTDDIEAQNDRMYEEVEYLEDGNIVKDAANAKESNKTRKCTKKQPKRERYENKRRQYSAEDLRKALDSVMAGTPVKDAAVQFQIPRRTLCTHAKLEKDRKTHPEASPEVGANYNLFIDIKAILTYTNATPFKSKTNKYYCAYCGTDGPDFEDPVDLRVHTRTEHAVERIKQVEFVMRPHYHNEILRVDIDNFLCNVCCLPITSWNEMFQHLQDAHNTKLDQACTRVIPYILRTALSCALCKQMFTTYMHLDVHMNTHYTNYMCRKCGDVFITSSRLKGHEKNHEPGRYACSYCNKVFTMEKYKRKHVNSVHKKLSGTKCQYCDEKFLGVFKRHNHVLEKHKDKVKIIACELCGKTFTMKYNYTAHMRKCHSESKFYQCNECGETFNLKQLLSEHNLTHRNEMTEYSCETCGKTYTKLNSLQKHVKSHKTVTVNRKRSSMTSRQ